MILKKLIVDPFSIAYMRPKRTFHGMKRNLQRRWNSHSDFDGPAKEIICAGVDRNQY
jgi:hypothetical protein